MNDEMEWMLTTDDDDHWYVIPTNKFEDFEVWINNAKEDWSPFPEWAHKVNGWPGKVKFKQWRVG